MRIVTALEAIAGRPALIECDRTVTGAQLLDDAKILVERLRSVPHSRLLLKSNSAQSHIVAIAAATILKSDIYLAHASLADELVDSIASAHAVDVRLGEYEGLLTTSCLSPSAKAEKGPDGRIMLMTSGTTSLPKVAGHTIESLTGRITATESSAAARWLLTYSPSTFAGLQVILTSLIGGGTLICAPGASIADLARSVTQSGVTHMSGTPSFFRMMLASLDGGDDCETVKQITVGGEAVDQHLLDRLGKRFPRARIHHIYASTEAGMVFNVTDGREGFPSEWLESGVTDVSLRINGGILEVKSPRRMTEYVSAHADPGTDDGWLSTGDLVMVDRDRVRFVGRFDIRLNVGGYKIAPEEVERALLSVDGIRDAQVTGVKSPLTGQALVATLVCAKDADRDALKSAAAKQLHQALEPYKVPRIYRFADSIETSLSGKKLRHATPASPSDTESPVTIEAGK